MKTAARFTVHPDRHRGRRSTVCQRRWRAVPEAEQHPRHPAVGLVDAGLLDEGGVRARVRDHGAERVQGDPARGELEPDPHEHPAGLDVLGRRAEQALEPAELPDPTHRRQVHALEDPADAGGFPQPAVLHREPEHRSGHEHRLGRQTVAGRRGLPLREPQPVQDLVVHGVVLQVVEQRLLVHPHDLVDGRPVGRGAEALPGCRRDGGRGLDR
ncbi:hypothetical protein QP157_15540 [Sphingomonas sp. LR61]|uniref:hypothetical protein n=1 Tax=Sphingomonas sp. LR61 TaxID=3050234 RepID=UPI002FE3B40A